MAIECAKNKFIKEAQFMFDLAKAYNYRKYIELKRMCISFTLLLGPMVAIAMPTRRLKASSVFWAVREP